MMLPAYWSISTSHDPFASQFLVDQPWPSKVAVHQSDYAWPYDVSAIVLHLYVLDTLPRTEAWYTLFVHVPSRGEQLRI